MDGFDLIGQFLSSGYQLGLQFWAHIYRPVWTYEASLWVTSKLGLWRTQPLGVSHTDKLNLSYVFWTKL